MINIELLWYPKCSTCKKAKYFLEDRKISFELRDIKNEIPTKEELKKLISKSEKDINSFFNTSGIKYRELNLKNKMKTMSNDEKLELLSSDGMLIKRPILITKEKIYIGFKEKEWGEIK